jgi:hypothetical protein
MCPGMLYLGSQSIIDGDINKSLPIEIFGLIETDSKIGFVSDSPTTTVNHDDYREVSPDFFWDDKYPERETSSRFRVALAYTTSRSALMSSGTGTTATRRFQLL